MSEERTFSGGRTFPIAERFVSINGEGPMAGAPAAFIRMKGCNLSCCYCDTAWANAPDCPCTYSSTRELLDWLFEQQIHYVTLTGGEPLLVPGIEELIENIGAAGLRVEIETNGSVDIRKYHHLPHRPAFTLDYKCPDSGMESAMLTENYLLLTENDTVKFVAASHRDLDRAYEIARSYHLGERCHVFLSAVFGRIEPKEIVNYMIEHHWNDARLQLQMHKFIWPPEQRGV